MSPRIPRQAESAPFRGHPILFSVQVPLSVRFYCADRASGDRCLVATSCRAVCVSKELLCASRALLVLFEPSLEFCMNSVLFRVVYQPRVVPCLLHVCLNNGQTQKGG